MTSHARQLVKNAIAAGYRVSVNDGGEWAVKMSDSYKDICDAIFSVDESTVRIRRTDKTVVGTALVILGNDPDEEVADHSEGADMLALIPAA